MPAKQRVVDYRIKYRRGKAPPGEQAEEERTEREILLRMRGVAFGLSIPLMLASGPVTGWLIGAWLDRVFGTSFWMIVLILLGTIAAFKMTIDMLIKLGKQQ